MADISQVTIPDGNSYSLKDARIAYCTCDTAAGTAAKVATPQSGEFRLAVGTIIGVKFTYTNTANNPTINVDGTGAKHIWYNNAAYTGKNSAITGSANRTSYYMYDGTYWVHLSNGIINENTYDRTYLSNTGYQAKSAIVAANIIVAGSDGLYFHLKTGDSFDITQPRLYASSACNAGATNNGGYIIIPFTVTTTQALTMTPFLPVYIKGTLTGHMFHPISGSCLTQTVPTSEDGYYYMMLGRANTATVMYLLPQHPIYAFNGGAFRPLASSWQVNSKTESGYVPYGNGHNSQVWATDASGNPSWRTSALYHNTRTTSANDKHSSNPDERVTAFLATSSMTTGKPPYDAHVLHFNWDNGAETTGTWDAQMAIRCNTLPKLWIRAQGNGTWSDWLDVSHVPTPTVQTVSVAASSISLNTWQNIVTISLADDGRAKLIIASLSWAGPASARYVSNFSADSNQVEASHTTSNWSAHHVMATTRTGTLYFRLYSTSTPTTAVTGRVTVISL